MDRVVELSSSLCLRVRQRAELGLGGSVWDAALTLSHLLTTPQLQALLPQPPTSSSSSASTGGGWLGQVVCELGSGTGVCGLTAAALGAERVVLTDVELYLPLLQLNIDRNRALLSCPSTTRLSAAAYHWGTPTLALRQRATGHDWGLGGDAGRDGQPVDVALPLPPRFPFSVLLVSDCVYDEAAFEPLQSALRRLVGPDTVRGATTPHCTAPHSAPPHSTRTSFTSSVALSAAAAAAHWTSPHRPLRCRLPLWLCALVCSSAATQLLLMSYEKRKEVRTHRLHTPAYTSTSPRTHSTIAVRRTTSTAPQPCPAPSHSPQRSPAATARSSLLWSV